MAATAASENTPTLGSISNALIRGADGCGFGLTALAKPLDLLITECPLVKWASDLSEQQQVSVLVDRRALELAGIDETQPLTIELNDIPLRSALRIALRDLDLTFLVEDEAIVITTLEVAEQRLVTKIYPIAGILDRTDAAGRDRAADFDALIELITRTICPETWEDVGGTGTIAAFPQRTCLVVSQLAEVHEALDRCLSLLYAARRDTNASSRTPPQPGPTEVKTVVYRLMEPLSASNASTAASEQPPGPSSSIRPLAAAALFDLRNLVLCRRQAFGLTKADTRSCLVS